MAHDVYIPFEVLNELNGSLKQIIVEFDSARRSSEALESAIGNPLGRNSLRNEAERFESEWDDKRETLKKDLEEVQKAVEEKGKAWSDWDQEASRQLSVDPGESSNLPKAV